MKHIAFKILMILSLLSTLPTPAFATGRSTKDVASWRTQISANCLKSVSPDMAAKEAKCECVARNFVVLSLREKKAQQVPMLKWIAAYYLKALPQSEIEKDPFYLDEYILHIGEGCINDANFKIK